MNEVTSQSLEEMLNEPGAPLYNWQKVLPAIQAEFKNSKSAEHRGALLEIFKTTMNILESTIKPEDLEKFKETRNQDYKLYIVQEALVGESICIDTLYEVTNREIAAGRMTDDHSLRKIAVDGKAAPHPTRAQLVAADGVIENIKYEEPQRGLRGAVSRFFGK